MNIRHSFTSEAELKSTLDWIYQQSLKGARFNSIIEVAFNEVTIITAIHNIKSNKGANTPGIDNKTMDEYLQMDKTELIELIQTSVRRYTPSPVKRVYIEKSNGKLRPLGLPSALDKIVQECLKIVLEPIAEAKFFPGSYGFRPYRATRHAMKNITYLIGRKTKDKLIYAIEGDIESFFDNLSHRVLLKKLIKMGITDKRVIAIIKQMLKAGYIELGIHEMTDKGTVQGGIISPLLANIYLNNFDWTIGRMYQYPKRQCKHIDKDRKRLRNNGTTKKFLVRYADDWIILTTTIQEAKRLLKYLIKYFKYRLKLKLSETKTVITDLTKQHAKFLGWVLKAGKPRKTPERPKPDNIVGKHYPDFEKLKAKVRSITEAIKGLYKIRSPKNIAVEIERINSKITGVANYHKTAICSDTFNYIDERTQDAAYRTFRRKYGKRHYREYLVPLDQLYNRPQRHKGYQTKTFAIQVDGMWIGITKAFVTHSRWLKYPFKQKMTPYTEEGRTLYMKAGKDRAALKDRQPIYDVITLRHSIQSAWNNFEYCMNREYAYNRDKGECKVCGKQLKKGNRHCHRIEESLPLGMINRVGNLAWLCKECHIIIHDGSSLEGLPPKPVKKIYKYREKLRESFCALS